MRETQCAGGQGFPAGSGAENPPAKAGDTGSILGREAPLEEGTATHSSVPAWRLPWTEEPGGLQPVGAQERQTRLSN